MSEAALVHSCMPGERLSDRAYDTLYRAITQCELAPGEIVSEPQLEQSYGFGRVPLRLAMDRLIQLQLVTPIHRRGYRIAPITLSDLRQTFELRLMVEPPAVRMAACRIDAAVLRQLTANPVPTARPGDRAAEALVMGANRRFHMLIAEACGNAKVVSIISQILSDIDRVYYFGLMRDARFADMRMDHTRLVDALEAKDGARAERIARKHIQTGFAIVMDAIVNDSSLARTTLRPAHAVLENGTARA